MRAALAGLLAGLCTAAMPSAQAVNAKSVVALAQAYLERWEPVLAAIVAEEHYVQALTEFTALGINRQSTRRLVSDVLLVRPPKDPIWMLFRDVLTVDEKPVRDRQRRFDALFVRSESVVAGARRIAEASARYNLGQLARDVNTPAAALIFLKKPFSESTSWKRPAGVDLDGARVWEVAFEQRRAPYAIRTQEGLPQPASGRIWIEDRSGRILKAQVEAWSVGGRTSNRPPRAWVQVTAHFGPVSGMDVWVPLRMDEQYRLYDAAANQMLERVEAGATYTNHRRFQTEARIVG
jgi:hypothetical protein